LRARADEKKIPLWPGDNVGYFGPYEHIIRKNRTRYGYSGGCSGGVLALGVEAHGEIKGCSAMSAPEFIGGNVRKQSIANIWDHSPQLHFNRKFDVESLWGFCRTCYYAEICKGGCPWTASVVMGRRGNNPYCHHRAIELAAKGKRERLVLKKAALGDIRDRAEIALVEEDMEPIAPPIVAASE
jgi:radical SAM protein with 4Fe4S-binding SPASM domain